MANETLLALNEFAELSKGSTSKDIDDDEQTMFLQLRKSRRIQYTNDLLTVKRALWLALKNQKGSLV